MEKSAVVTNLWLNFFFGHTNVQYIAANDNAQYEKSLIQKYTSGPHCNTTLSLYQLVQQLHGYKKGHIHWKLRHKPILGATDNRQCCSIPRETIKCSLLSSHYLLIKIFLIQYSLVMWYAVTF